MDKKCQRCGSMFICTPEDITNCACSKASPSRELKYFLSKTEYDCLCNSCISELEDQLKEAKKYSLPIRRENYKEGVHYYMEGEFFVFKELFHIIKGECCRNNCRHCAYGYNKT